MVSTFSKTPSYLERELAEQLSLGDTAADLIDRGWGDGFWYWDLEHRDNAWLSPKAWETLGYPASTLRRNLNFWRECIVAEDLERLNEALPARIEVHPRVVDEMVSFKHHNGSLVQFRCRGELEKKSGLAPQRMLVMMQDVTGLKDTELTARYEKQRYELAIDAIKTGIWDWTDTQSADVYWSPSFFRMLGYDNGAFTVTFERFIELLHPDDRERTQAAVDAHLADKNVPYDLEYRMRRKDGEYSWFHAVGTALRDAAGDPVRMLGRVELIDDRVVAQQTLQKAEERFSLAVAGASVGVWDWMNVECSEQYWSPRFYHLLGYQPDEIQASFENFAQLLHPDDQQPLFNAIDAHLSAKTPFDMEYRLRCSDGNYRWFRGTGIAARDESDRPTRMVGSIADIHQRRLAEEQVAIAMEKLAESNHDLEQFAYAASHDLQEPLRTVTSFLNLIERRYEEVLPAEAKEFFGIVTDACERMKNLISDLMDYSRVRDGEIELKPVDLSQKLGQLIDHFGEQYPGVEIRGTYPDKLVVPGIGTYLERLFSNLIGNAIKYCDPDRPVRIVVKAALEDHRAVITFEDNGIGIDARHFERIFQVFQRLHGMNEYSGTGIGLALCQRIVKVHRGTINVSSQPGQGSCFTVTLPLNTY